jgi:hypothetical protein
MRKPEHRRAADRSGLRYPAKSMALVEQLIDQSLQPVRGRRLADRTALTG